MRNIYFLLVGVIYLILGLPAGAAEPWWMDQYPTLVNRLRNEKALKTSYEVRDGHKIQLELRESGEGIWMSVDGPGEMVGKPGQRNITILGDINTD